jgi:hypothetical protein
MKTIYLSVLITIISISTTVSGNDSNDNINNYHIKAININPAFSAMRNGFGISTRIDYENSKIGKFIAGGELGYMLGAIQLDMEIGNGYPLLYAGNTTLFANGYLTWLQLSGFEPMWIGPTGVAEFEYRKTFEEFALSIAPFCRIVNLYNYAELRYNDKFSDRKTFFSYGLKVGFVYRFSL